MVSVSQEGSIARTIFKFVETSGQNSVQDSGLWCYFVAKFRTRIVQSKSFMTLDDWALGLTKATETVASCFPDNPGVSGAIRLTYSHMTRSLKTVRTTTCSCPSQNWKLRQQHRSFREFCFAACLPQQCNRLPSFVTMSQLRIQSLPRSTWQQMESTKTRILSRDCLHPGSCMADCASEFQWCQGNLLVFGKLKSYWEKNA